jgi:hypothetical protein
VEDCEDVEEEHSLEEERRGQKQPLGKNTGILKSKEYH